MSDRVYHGYYERTLLSYCANGRCTRLAPLLFEAVLIDEYAFIKPIIFLIYLALPYRVKILGVKIN